MWWLAPAIAALGSLTQADCREFEGSLGFQLRPWPKKRELGSHFNMEIMRISCL